MVLALILAAALAAPAAETRNPWSLLAQNDIDAMHAQILANHPGPVDPQNPAFAKWLEDGYRAASAKASEVTTFGGFVYAVRYYGAGFRDGHLNSGVNLSTQQVGWPSFTVTLRGDRYVVAAVATPGDASLPAVGSEIVDCDGRAPRTIIEEDVWPYAMGPILDSNWRCSMTAEIRGRSGPQRAASKSATRSRRCRCITGM